MNLPITAEFYSGNQIALRDILIDSVSMDRPVELLGHLGSRISNFVSRVGTVTIRFCPSTSPQGFRVGNCYLIVHKPSHLTEIKIHDAILRQITTDKETKSLIDATFDFPEGITKDLNKNMSTMQVKRKEIHLPGVEEI
jgi:hypothetical protein